MKITSESIIRIELTVKEAEALYDSLDHNEKARRYDMAVATDFFDQLDTALDEAGE